MAAMDDSPCEDLCSEFVNSLHDTYGTFVGEDKHTVSDNSTFEKNAAVELAIALCKHLNIEDAHLASDGTPLDHSEESKMYEEPNLVALSSETAQKSLTKSATFPCSTITGNCESIACNRSMSLPPSFKLVSALKGSREKQGISPKKLTLTWAPEVYDPPVTSASHTVKGYIYHRSRSSPKHSTKHKHKTKSSHGSSSSSSSSSRSSSDKKQYRKSVGSSSSRSKSTSTRDKSQSSDPKSPETRSRTLIEDFNRSRVGLLDFSTSGQDTKCGSSFLGGSLATVHFPVAEAT